MSFSFEQKTEIINQTIKKACCRRALLQGVLASRGDSSGETITISVESPVSAEFISKLILEIYSKEAQIRSHKSGGRRKIIEFSSSSADKYISDFRSGELTFTPKCPQCKSYFWQGVFLASGRVTNPLKQYCLEFSSRENTDRLCRVLSDNGLTPRISEKPGETVIYFKRSEQIEDFFALAGMNQTVFAFMDAKMQNELRNNVNRIRNCETNNIDKAVSSSMHQVELINELMRRGLISQLPDELEITARMRAKHSDLSLSQLAALITPPITKPGLSHRLKKITELAEKILKKGDLGNT